MVIKVTTAAKRVQGKLKITPVLKVNWKKAYFNEALCIFPLQNCSYRTCIELFERFLQISIFHLLFFK